MQPINLSTEYQSEGVYPYLIKVAADRHFPVYWIGRACDRPAVYKLFYYLATRVGYDPTTF